jgi:hypothetical protein
MTITPSRVLGLLTACILIVGCQRGREYRASTVSLSVGAPADAASGLRLVAVDADGTAHIEWGAVRNVVIVRPNTATNQVSLWVLDSTDSATQTAKLSAFLHR